MKARIDPDESHQESIDSNGNIDSQVSYNSELEKRSPNETIAETDEKVSDDFILIIDQTTFTEENLNSDQRVR